MEIGSFIGHFRAASKDVRHGGASLESGGNHGGGASGSGSAWVPPPASVLFDPTRDILFNAPFTREQYNLVVDGSKKQQLAEEADHAVTTILPYNNPDVLRGFLSWTRALTAATERALGFSQQFNGKTYDRDAKNFFAGMKRGSEDEK